MRFSHLNRIRCCFLNLRDVAISCEYNACINKQLFLATDKRISKHYLKCRGRCVYRIFILKLRDVFHHAALAYVATTQTGSLYLACQYFSIE